jgi:hypothetical protein
MSYYAKEDILLRDAPGTDGRLQRWDVDAKQWSAHPQPKRLIGQNVLVPISTKDAEAMKKAGWGPSQPAKALTGKTKGKKG